MAESENFRRGESSASSDETLAEFNNSFAFDRRLFAADIRVGVAYAAALFHAGILTRQEAERVKNGLQTILKRSGYDKNYFDEPAEDVHSFIDTRLVQLVGEAGGKLRIGRTRRDRTATALRLWLREEIEQISSVARALQLNLIEAAERQREAVLPGYAHLRRAQPILWAHWCLAYFEMLARNRERLDEVWRRVNVLPLGAAALAGTNYEIDREQIAVDLRFEGVCANSLDAVGDRDFAVEFVGAAALIMVHLSRFAEDLILYASSEFGFVELSGAASSGSNLSPGQRKNSHALELIRGKAGRIFGHQTALLTTLKGLPMSYNKDLQEDKEAVFDTVDTVKICLEMAAAVLKNLRVRDDKSRRAASEGYLNARELVDYLVQKNVPFADARRTVEKIVAYASTKNMEIDALSLSELQNFSAHIEPDVFAAIGLEQTLAGKSQIGGTAPERVFEALETAKNSLEMER